MSPFRYQLTVSELATELGISEPTIRRRKDWAQRHYDQWKCVFLYNGLIDIREWQKMISAFSDYQYEAHEDPHMKLLRKGVS